MGRWYLWCSSIGVGTLACLGGGGALRPKAAKTAQAAHLGGCGGMPPQENFENLVLRDAI